MAFKVKNPFIHKHTTNNQRTLGRDGRVISPVKQDHDLDSRDPNNIRPIYTTILTTLRNTHIIYRGNEKF